MFPQAFLRRLVYKEYFRDEPPPPDEHALLPQIEGFGSFRPAYFADPHSPLAAALPDNPALLNDTPYTVGSDGQVRAEFSLPAKLSLQQKRRRKGKGKAARPEGLEAPSVPHFTPPSLPDNDK